MIISAISWVITGLIVGAIARLLVPGRQDISTIGTIVLGIVGAVVGGFLSSMIWPVPANADPAAIEASTMWPGWLMAILGGTLVVWLYASATAPRRSIGGTY